MTVLQIPFPEFAAYGGALAVRATGVLAGALLLAVLLRRSTAAARHALWTVTLCALVTLPVLPVLLPTIPVPVPWTAPQGEDPPLRGTGDGPAGPAGLGPGRAVGPEWEADGDGGAMVAHLPGSREVLGDGSAQAIDGDGVRADATAGPGHRSGSAPGSRSGPAPGSRPGPVTLVLAWLTGASILAGFLGVGLWRAGRLLRRAVRAPGEEWARSLERARRAAGLRRPVSIGLSPEVRTALAGGFLRPAVLLPEAARSWDRERRDLVLLHEVVHLKRADPLRHVLGRIALALYWFHPLAWLAVRAATLAREQACDEAVLALGHRPSTYARHLVELAEPDGLPMPAVARIDRPPLERRIMAILRPHAPGRPGAVLTAALLGAVWALTVAAVGPQERPTPEPIPAPAPREVPPSVSAPAPREAPAPMPLPVPWDAPTPMPVPTPSEAPAPSPPASPWEAPTPSPLPSPWETPTPSPLPSSWEVPTPSPAPTPWEALASIGRSEAAATALRAEPRPGGVPSGLEASDPALDLLRGCRLREDGINFDDGRDFAGEARGERGRFIQMSLDELMLCIRTFGDVDLEESGAGIRSISEGGWVVLAVRGEGVMQRLEITPSADGFEHAWFVEGTRRPFDDRAREWRDAMLGVLGAQVELATIRGEAGRLRGEIARTRGEEARLRGQIAQIRGETARFRGEMAQGRAEEARLRGEIQRIHGEEAQLRGEIVRIRGEGTRERGEVASLRSTVVALESAGRVTRDDDTRARLHAEIEEIRTQLREAERRTHVDAGTALADAERRLAAHRRATAPRLAELESELRQAVVEERQAAAAPGLEGRSREAATRIAELEEALAGMDVAGEVRELQEQLSDLETDRRIAEVEAQREAAKERLRALIRDIP